MRAADRLRDSIRRRPRMLVLFSGGLDSTVLARLALDELGDGACALTFSSPVMSSCELEEAGRAAGLMGIRRVVLPINELEDRSFAANPPDRCYICRKMRNDLALSWARENGFSVVADGLNATDLSDYRPGMAASREDGIWQPFVEFGLTKDDIRALARELGMASHDRPPTVCLCSRFPAAFPIEEPLLRRVEAAEGALRGLGFGYVRVRHFPYETAVVQVEDPAALLGVGPDVERLLKGLGYLFTCLDLEPLASGSMNRIVLSGLPTRTP